MNRVIVALLALVFGAVFWAVTRDTPIEQTTSEVIQESYATAQDVAKNPFLNIREWEPLPDQPFD